MINKEYEVLLPFVISPWKQYHLKEVKKLSKKKSESYVFNTLKKFVKEKILSEKKVGNLVLYSLDLSNTQAQITAGFLAENHAWKEKQIPQRVINKLMQKIPTNFFIFIVTGSYAKNTQKESSDLDVAIVIDEKIRAKSVYAELNLECDLSIPKVHLYVFKSSEFYLMLTNKEANYGKEIAKNNLIFYGGQVYYRIIKEAIENGFGDKKLS